MILTAHQPVYLPWLGFFHKIILSDKYVFLNNVQYSKNGSDPRNYKVNFDKVKNVLNFSSSYSIQDGIEEIIKYLQDENLETIRKNRNYYGNYFLKK